MHPFGCLRVFFVVHGGVVWCACLEQKNEIEPKNETPAPSGPRSWLSGSCCLCTAHCSVLSYSPPRLGFSRSFLGSCLLLLVPARTRLPALRRHRRVLRCPWISIYLRSAARRTPRRLRKVIVPRPAAAASVEAAHASSCSATASARGGGGAR